MTPRLFLVSTLVLCASAAAQHVTSPPGFLDKEGNTNTTFCMGNYSDGHFQYADGHHRGTAMTIKGTAYRAGNYAYTTANGMGRKWTNVEVNMSKCDLAAFGNTYTKNQTTAPTRVFTAAVSWPTLTGKPQKYPADFAMHFPFSTNWSYDGKGDICVDYKFTGGTLANNYAWSISRSVNYYLDSQSYATYVTVSSTQLGKSGNNQGCNDRRVTHTYGAHVYSSLTVYSGDYSTVSLRNKIAFTQNGNYFPPSQSVLTVAGFKSLRKGVVFAESMCNKIHIDLSFPAIFIPSFTNSSGSLVRMNLSTANPGIDGAEIVTQCAWTDSVTKKGLLSDAALLLGPEEPPIQPASLLYSHVRTAPTGSATKSRNYQPVRRYTK